MGKSVSRNIESDTFIDERHQDHVKLAGYQCSRKQIGWSVIAQLERISYANSHLGVLTCMKISLKSSTGIPSSPMVGVQKFLDSCEKLEIFGSLCDDGWRQESRSELKGWKSYMCKDTRRIEYNFLGSVISGSHLTEVLFSSPQVFFNIYYELNPIRDKDMQL